MLRASTLQVTGPRCRPLPEEGLPLRHVLGLRRVPYYYTPPLYLYDWVKGEGEEYFCVHGEDSIGLLSSRVIR